MLGEKHATFKFRKEEIMRGYKSVDMLSYYYTETLSDVFVVFRLFTKRVYGTRVWFSLYGSNIVTDKGVLLVQLLSRGSCVTLRQRKGYKTWLESWRSLNLKGMEGDRLWPISLDYHGDGVLRRVVW
jgi:hypothetical protein